MSENQKKFEEMVRKAHEECFGQQSQQAYGGPPPGYGSPYGHYQSHHQGHFQAPPYGYGHGPGFDHGFHHGFGGNPDVGLFGAFPQNLFKGNSQQFLMGLLLGGAAAYVLSDDELREKIIKKAMKMYGGVMGSFEEMKEQMADLKAEMEAGQS